MTLSWIPRDAEAIARPAHGGLQPEGILWALIVRSESLKSLDYKAHLARSFVSMMYSQGYSIESVKGWRGVLSA